MHFVVTCKLQRHGRKLYPSLQVGKAIYHRQTINSPFNVLFLALIQVTLLCVNSSVATATDGQLYFFKRINRLDNRFESSKNN